MQFAALTVLAALGVALTKFATDDLEKLKLSYGNLALGIVAALCIGVSAGCLYLIFNKK